MATPTGICRLCGTFGPLSFEHVPPQAAFNDRRIIKYDYNAIFGPDRQDAIGFDGMRGKYVQRGSGGYAFCGGCNSDTGGWYARAYVDWAYQGMRMSDHAARAPSLYFPFKIFPLRVIKQILCIFFATSDEGFRQHRPDLVRFLLNKHETGIRPDTRIYGYYNSTGRVRQTGRTVRTTFGSMRDFEVLSEFSFRPWGFVLAESPRVPDTRLVDLTGFAKFAYSDECAVALQIPILSVVTPFPADYRNDDEVRVDAIKNIAQRDTIIAGKQP